MKKFILFSLFLSFSAIAADFTISLQSFGDGSKKNYYYRKSNNLKLGEYVFLGGQHGVKLSNGEIQNNQLFNILFSGPGCTGSIYVQGTGIPVGMYITNNGAYYRVEGPHLANPIQSRLQFNTTICESLSATLNSAPISPAASSTGFIDLTGASSQGLNDTNMFYLKVE